MRPTLGRSRTKVSGCGGTGAPVGLCRAAPASGDDKDSGAPCKDGLGRCDGTSVVYCAAGRTRHVSCDALGLNRCVKDAHGARCR